MWIVIIGIGVCYSAYNIKLCAIRYYSYPSAVKLFGFTLLCPDVSDHQAYRTVPHTGTALACEPTKAIKSCQWSCSISKSDGLSEQYAF